MAGNGMERRRLSREDEAAIEALLSSGGWRKENDGNVIYCVKRGSLIGVESGSMDHLAGLHIFSIPNSAR